MKFVTAAGMREGEGGAILRDPPLGLAMMDRAGRGLALEVAVLAKQTGGAVGGIRLLAGPGNNGGDAFAAAIHLSDMGLRAEVWIACPLDRLKGAAQAFFERMVARGIPHREVVDEKDWDKADAEVSPPRILVDALLGTGAAGAPRGAIGRAIGHLRARSGECLIVSADLPSGMDADTGMAEGGVVPADMTVTMGFPKRGMAAPGALEALGTLRVAPIGLPGECADAMPDARPDLRLITGGEVRGILPRRARGSHKGTHGRALLMGGSEAFPGAIVLAAEGAVRSGAGLVQVSTVGVAAAAVVARAPEVIARADLSADLPLEGSDAILAGPGLGRGPETRRMVARLLREAPGPLVLDADAIAALEDKPEVVRSSGRPVILTPHPGELARLLGRSAGEIQRDRSAAAREAAERTGAIVVLKGAGTLVAKAGEPLWINLTGNPGMGCGGSGDVLAGLLAGLLAQGIPPFEAACAAVWLHGVAGDLAAWRWTQAAMSAGDIARAIPDAFGLASPR